MEFLFKIAGVVEDWYGYQKTVLKGKIVYVTDTENYM